MWYQPGHVGQPRFKNPSLKLIHPIKKARTRLTTQYPRRKPNPLHGTNLTYQWQQWVTWKFNKWCHEHLTFSEHHKLTWTSSYQRNLHRLFNIRPCQSSRLWSLFKHYSLWLRTNLLFSTVSEKKPVPSCLKIINQGNGPLKLMGDKNVNTGLMSVTSSAKENKFPPKTWIQLWYRNHTAQCFHSAIRQCFAWPAWNVSAKYVKTNYLSSW
jgi:hypothetical protein